jgi:cell division transport system ATP-binding protein
VDHKNTGVINLANMSLSYDGKNMVLQNVNYFVNKGDFIILTGASGSGKSTLLKSFYGVLKPMSGYMEVNGVEISESKNKEIYDLRRSLGIIFQDFKLIKQLNVKRNVFMPLEIEGSSWSQSKEKVERLLGYVDILHLANKMPAEISGGEQQRVAFARALVSNPDIILADEPTGNLDQKSTDIIYGLLEAANRSGKTVIIATHAVPENLSVPFKRIAIKERTLVEQ